MGLCLEKQLMSPQKIIVISKVHYFDFLVSCLYTFNPLSLYHWNGGWWPWLKQHTEGNVEIGKSCKINNMIRAKESGRRPFIFISRLNIVQRNSNQADEIVMEIEEWKQKVQDNCLKSFTLLYKSFTRCVGDINYDSCFNAVTHIYIVFPGITNTYHSGQNIWK